MCIIHSFFLTSILDHIDGEEWALTSWHLSCGAFCSHSAHKSSLLMPIGFPIVPTSIFYLPNNSKSPSSFKISSHFTFVSIKFFSFSFFFRAVFVLCILQFSVFYLPSQLLAFLFFSLFLLFTFIILPSPPSTAFQKHTLHLWFPHTLFELSMECRTSP